MLASLPKYAAMVGLAVAAAVAQPALAADSPAPAASVPANTAQPVAWDSWHHRWGDTGAFIGGLGVGLAAGAALGAPYYGYYPYDYYGYGYGPWYGYYAGPTVVAPAVPAVPAGDAVAYCEAHFKSYDPATGTYLGYDGIRHPCP